MPPPIASNKDISAMEGALIVREAKSWKGTPYKMIGASSAKSLGGDCSGTTWRIYTVAGFSYDYQATATFLAYVQKTGRFRLLTAQETAQEGDLLFWDGHMAIYTSFSMDKDNATTPRTNAKGQPWAQVNDMWTATRPGGGDYQPGKISYFKPSPPKFFRYQK